MHEKEKELIYKIANQALENKDYGKAIENFQKLLPYNYLDVADKLKETHYQLGKEQLESKNCKQAIENFKKVKDYKDVPTLIEQAERCGKPPLPVWLIPVALLMVFLIGGAFFVFRRDGEATPTTTTIALINTNTPTPVPDAPTPTSLPPETFTPIPPIETPTPTPTPSKTVPDTPTFTPIPLPAAPTNLQVSDATTNTLTLNWINPADGQAQVILQQDGIVVAELPPDAQSYTVEGLACESSYNFTIIIVSEAGQSEPAQITAQTIQCQSSPLQLPTAPTNVQASGVTQTSLTLSWTNPVDNYTGVILEKDGTTIAELPPHTQSYTIEGLTCGKLFNFTIRTVNDTGQSESVKITASTTDCPPSLSGKIAVPVFKGGMYDIYVASADNNWSPELLFDCASQPEFSEDGQRMVVRSWEHQNWGQQLVYLPNFLDITNFVKLTNFVEDAHPNLNSANDIVFHSRQQNPKGEPIIVRIGTYSGASETKLGEGVNPDWLSDNRIIFYASFPKAGVYVMNEDGSNKVFTLPIPGKVVPAAAPNGDRVAISLHRDGHWQIFSFSVSGGEGSLTQLTLEASADSYLPTWSPDGNYIAFASNREGSWAIWVMSADGSDQRKLFDLPGSLDGQISATNIGQGLSFGWGEEKLSWSR